MKELNTNQVSTVTQMRDSGKSYSAISTAIIALDFVANQKEADEVLSGLGIEKGRKANLTDKMYAYLQEKPRTQSEFFKWMKTNGTANTWRWRAAHDKVRELTVRLHVELSGVKFEEKPYVEPAPVAEVKAEPPKAETKTAKAPAKRTRARTPAKVAKAS